MLLTHISPVNVLMKYVSVVEAYIGMTSVASKEKKNTFKNLRNENNRNINKTLFSKPI